MHFLPYLIFYNIALINVTNRMTCWIIGARLVGWACELKRRESIFSHKFMVRYLEDEFKFDVPDTDLDTFKTPRDIVILLRII